MQLLLLSNSTQHGQPMLAHATDAITEIVPDGRVVFVPFALADHDAYTATVAAALAVMGIEAVGAHTLDDPIAAIEQAGAVYVGGGNSFRLLQTLQRRALLHPIADAVRAGAIYMGASAGSNLACPSIRTTNDMPIVQPDDLWALGLLGFQINPHFIDADPTSTHMGETREKRIAEFHERNDVDVLGLREGAWLRVRNNRAELGGSTGAVLLRRGEPLSALAPGADLSALLSRESRFDIA